METAKLALNKIGNALFNTRAAGFYILAFAAAIGIATFVENDFGTPAAQKLIYKTRWFELLLVLFSITLLVNIVKFKMVKQRKWALLIFHGAMVLILIGAGVTRYFGYEGMMHIREGSSSSQFLSADTYLNFDVEQNGQFYSFNEPVLFAGVGSNEFNETYQIGSQLVKVELEEVIPNPQNTLETAEDGRPILKVVFGSSMGRQEYYLVQGDKRTISGIDFNFSDELIPGSYQIVLRNDSLLFRSDEAYTQTVMATQSVDTLQPDGKFHELRLRSLYSGKSAAFVFGEYNPMGKFKVKSEGLKLTSSSSIALVLKVTVGDYSETRMVHGVRGGKGQKVAFGTNETRLLISYGAKSIQVPFRIGLREFIMERYPGTNSPASYASEVTLIDDAKGHQEDFRIYMNNILNYGGYRFFQSSYDRDEKGTYLSVNHDFWGTWISYLGYALLTLGLIMTFFTKNTRFSQLVQKLKMLRRASNLILLFTALSLGAVHAQTEVTPTVNVISPEHADLFSKVMVQDFRGRIKPMHTLNRELMRKIHGSETIGDWSADQVILSMYASKQEWYAYPLITLGKHEKVGALVGASGKKASYRDFFDQNGQYKLKAEVTRANNLEPIDRGTFEKQLLKVDERVNIVGMAFSGTMLQIVPVEGDANNTWVSEHSHGSTPNAIAQKFFTSYKSALHDALHKNNTQLANQLLTELMTYQKEAGAAIMPPDSKISAEILLNNSKVFSRLALIYTLLGMVFLIMLFVSVFNPKINLQKLSIFFIAIAALGFIFHTIGLGLRWYVSGRAPWSNGYESMIYIAWTTALAGLFFSRKSLGGMAATMVQSGNVLLIAMLSFLDPEITPLVPVLKSYWLTIHVSLEAGSYGFLMLGALIGLINLLLIATLTKNNLPRVKRVVKELSYISELTLMVGLVMISIGTYLGGVWANESWGRYWGWDAKETWALVSILVYAFILHMRLIPKLGGLFAFNFATLFGLSSVIMTYYGVNYYLSGLHSYAAGDPVPIPQWVYIAITCVAIVSLIAYLQKRRFKLMI